MSDTNQAVLDRIAAVAGSLPGMDLELPPQVFHLLGGRFTHFDQASATLIARFPVKVEYRNPMRFMQGGMIIAAMDNTMGPLCFLCGFFGVSTQINTAFVRPVTAEEAWIEVEAHIVERTRNVAQVVATTRNALGKTVALCHATFTATSPPDDRGPG